MLGKCLSALKSQDYSLNFEVIVVDDGSPNQEAIAIFIKEWEKNNNFPIRFIPCSHHGPAATRNIGVKHASGDIVCFLDDDSFVSDAWLEHILHQFKKQDNIIYDLVSGCIRSYDRTKGLSLKLEQAVYHGRHWATCNIAYRKDVFEKLGGFDETFPEASWEDNELGLRAKWAGFHYVYAKEAVVYHNHEPTMKKYKRKCLLNGRGAFVFCNKYIREKPFWALVTPILMSRRLIYAVLPPVWIRNPSSPLYLRFLWSYYSLQGFLSMFLKKS